MNLLWIAGWYPHYLAPISGDFVKRHAEAVSLYHDVQVLFVARDIALKPGAVKVHTSKNGRLTEWIITYNSPAWMGKIGSQLMYVRLFKKYIRQYVKEYRPDLVHFHIGMRTCTLAHWIRHTLKLPYVVTEHWGGFLPEAPHNFSALPVYLQQKWRYMINHALACHTVSDHLATHVRRLAKNSLSVKIIPNTVDTTIFFPGNEPKKKQQLVHVSNTGADTKNKNTEDVLRAFALLQKKYPGVHLDIAGPYDVAIPSLIGELGITSNVSLHGEISQPALSNLFRQAQALIIYSRYETFGCVVIEAQACGTMVVTSDIPVMHETIENNRTGYIIPGENPEELKNTLEAIINGERTLHEKSIANDATEKYSYSSVGQQFSQWYNEIMKNRGRN